METGSDKLFNSKWVGDRSELRNFRKFGKHRARMSKKLNAGQPCYYCGAPSTSVEHIPPKSLLKDVDCNRITVPSCPEHNSTKPKSDQSILSAYALVLASNWGKDPLTPLAIKTVRRLRRGVPYVKNTVIKREIPLSLGIVRQPRKTAFLVNTDMHSWIVQMTAGWIWHALEARDPDIDWAKVETWSPDNLPMKQSLSPINRIELNQIFRARGQALDLMNSLHWLNGWSSVSKPYPSDIYHFELSLDSDAIAFKHKFFNVFTYYAWIIGIDPQTVDRLRRKSLEAKPV